MNFLISAMSNGKKTESTRKYQTPARHAASRLRAMDDASDPDRETADTAASSTATTAAGSAAAAAPAPEAAPEAAKLEAAASTSTTAGVTARSRAGRSTTAGSRSRSGARTSTSATRSSTSSRSTAGTGSRSSTARSASKSAAGGSAARGTASGRGTASASKGKSGGGGASSGGHIRMLSAWRSSKVKGDEAAVGMARQDLQLKTFNSSIVTAAMFFALAGITLTTTGAYVYRSMQSSLVPYVVTVDTHGVVRSQGTVEPVSAATLPPEVISSQLCSFISDVRLISTDKEVQRQAVSHVFALLRKGSTVYRQLHEYYSANNPMVNTRNRQVRVEIANIIPRGPSSYQIDWTEKSTDSDGLASPDKKMRAIISYELSTAQSSDPAMVMLNPLNLYITEYTVSPVLS